MLSLLYYIFLVVACTIFFIISLIALVVCAPFDRGRRVVHELTRILTYIFFGASPFWRVKVEGLEHVDRKGRYVIVINHQNMIDIPSLYFVPLNFRWVSKREVFRTPFFGQFLVLHGDIAIDRGDGTKAMEQILSKGDKWLKRGASIAIFPEGTRSRSGEIMRFKSGAFTLAKESGVAILPVVMDGTKSLINPNFIINWHNKITVRVLPPVDAERVAASDVKSLMDGVREDMIEALREIREENK